MTISDLHFLCQMYLCMYVSVCFAMHTVMVEVGIRDAYQYHKGKLCQVKPSHVIAFDTVNVLGSS